MDNFNVVYDYTDSDDSDINSNNNSDCESVYDIANIVRDNSYNIIINSLDREWINTYKNTFSFNIKFNSTLSKIPVLIKNIYEISINYIQLPIRNIILESGSKVSITKLNGLVLTIDELNKNCYGTNEILNKSFGTFLATDDTPNYIQLTNVNESYKFYPATLNTINTLTFNFFDLDGMKIKYDLDSLEIKKMTFDTNNKLISLHFDSDLSITNNYLVNDLIILKKNNITGTNSNILNDYLNNNTHLINFSDINTIKIKYPSSGKVNDYIETNSNEIQNNLGYLLNKNLQIKLFMNIKTKEKDIEFKSELI